MNDKHISSQFDKELNDLSSRVLEMGGLVEMQIATAVRALSEQNPTLSDLVFENENTVDRFEVELDNACIGIIARRQPTARDLRLLMAIAKTLTNLERVGDEACKIARAAKSIAERSSVAAINFSALRRESELAIEQLHRALDCLARLDAETARQVLKDDQEIDQEFGGFVRKLITYVLEDPRTISTGVDLLFSAKAIERIGDHAKNIAESVIYIVQGTDVRHSAQEE